MPEPRISKVLPTVKCSDCNQAVHVRELADHVCHAAPPVPAIPQAPIRIDTCTFRRFFRC
ncbi:hypothetical protein BJV82DRAFT_273868 [Fennellomyces sp. T-0311]|nr:hypothetical protein BJV82DRAFT_273868 [Fennellomyces sp. T-0311]